MSRFGHLDKLYVKEEQLVLIVNCGFPTLWVTIYQLDYILKNFMGCVEFGGCAQFRGGIPVGEERHYYHHAA
jgi:hypothetical protein